MSMDVISGYHITDADNLFIKVGGSGKLLKGQKMNFYSCSTYQVTSTAHMTTTTLLGKVKQWMECFCRWAAVTKAVKAH